MDRRISIVEGRCFPFRRTIAVAALGLTALWMQHGFQAPVEVVSETPAVGAEDVTTSTTSRLTTTTQKKVRPNAATDPRDFIKWAAVQYQTTPNRALCVAQRESNFQPDVVNTWDSNAKKGVASRGMFQFVEQTADYVADHTTNVPAWRELGLTYSPHGSEVTNSAAIKASWPDPGVQTLLFFEAQNQGLASHWSTHDPRTEC